MRIMQRMLTCDKILEKSTKRGFQQKPLGCYSEINNHCVNGAKECGFDILHLVCSEKLTCNRGPHA